MGIKELDKLKELDFHKQAAFAYLTCERLYPNYVYFSENYNFGNPAVLREAIDYIYDNLFEQNIDKNRIQTLIQKVEKNTPDPGEFDTILSSSALDACGTIYDSLDFLVDKQFNHIKSISQMATDTTDMYIRDVNNIDEYNNKNWIQLVNDHPLMKKEVAIQSGIISFLNNRKTLDYGDIHTLLRLQENEKKGSLNL